MHDTADMADTDDDDDDYTDDVTTSSLCSSADFLEHPEEFINKDM